MEEQSDLRRLESLLGMDTMRVHIEIVFDPGKHKLRARAENVWVRFPNRLRVRGAIYEAEVRRAKADSFITIGAIKPVNDIAKSVA